MFIFGLCFSKFQRLFEVGNSFIQITCHLTFFISYLLHSISLSYLSSNCPIATCFYFFITSNSFLSSSCVIVFCKSIFWRFISSILLRRASSFSSSFLLFFSNVFYLLRILFVLRGCV